MLVHLILSIILRQKNEAFCWNNSVTLVCFAKIFAKNIGFTYETPARVPDDIKTTPGTNKQIHGFH